MKSVMTNRLAISPSVGISRSTFDRSHGVKTTFDASNLIPIFVDEALPGDTFTLKSSFFARLATPIFPIMDNMFLETFWFEVPVRQVWDNWEKFNGEQDNPDDSTDFLIPQTLAPEGGYQEQSLQDYMGLPTLVENYQHSALFLRCYNHIYNTWFRDQNLQDSVIVDKGDGPDDPANYVLLKRGKRHDYFTSSLPWPQKSDAGSVPLPLGESAPVVSNQGVPNYSGVISTEPENFLLQASDDDGIMRAGVLGVNEWIPGEGMKVGDESGLFADLTNATAATINQLRQSIAIQRLFEKDARGGTRYIEVIKNHFNVTSPDLRLQRPGYLGGGRTMVNITPVAQTVDDDQGAPGTRHALGDLAAYGTIGATDHGFTKSFTEHTIIIGLANVRADLTYQNCLNRMWSRQTRFDHYWPELATIGEQSVLQQEIFTSNVTAENETVFGYQERFAEYRYKPSMITGKFRSNSPETLDAWHLSQDFADAPVLGPTFIEENVPLDRCIAVVPSVDSFRPVLVIPYSPVGIVPGSPLPGARV